MGNLWAMIRPWVRALGEPFHGRFWRQMVTDPHVAILEAPGPRVAAASGGVAALVAAGIGLGILYGGAALAGVGRLLGLMGSAGGTGARAAVTVGRPAATFAGWAARHPIASIILYGIYDVRREVISTAGELGVAYIQRPTQRIQVERFFQAPGGVAPSVTGPGVGLVPVPPAAFPRRATFGDAWQQLFSGQRVQAAALGWR